MMYVMSFNVWFSTEEGESFMYVYALSGALAFNSVLLVFLAYAAYTTYKKNCKCTGRLNYFFTYYCLCLI